MANKDEQFETFPDRKSLAQRGVHKNEKGPLSLTESGRLESLLLDSDIFSEDCGKEVRLFVKGDLDLSSVAKVDGTFRLIRSSTLNSPFAPEAGFRCDGEYRNTFRDWQVLEEDDTWIRGIILERVSESELPLRKPFRQIIELLARNHLEWRIEFIGGVAEVLAFTRYGVVLHVRLESKGTMQTYLYFRLWSSDAEGDRTDWHEVLPLMLALFLRRERGISCALFDQLNPAAPGLEAEIYGRYIVFGQENKSDFSSRSNPLSSLERLLESILFFGLIFREALEWSHENGHCEGRFSYEDARDWSRSISDALGISLKKGKQVFNRRVHPDWKFFRDVAAGISVIESQHLTENLTWLCRIPKQSTIVESHGTFYLLDGCKNFLSSRARLRLKRACRRLTGKSEEITLVPLENLALAIAPPYLISFWSECGIRAFNRARDAIQGRHKAERELLFPPVAFSWTELVDDDRFEALVLELLQLERGVVRAKRTGVSRDADQGRDLIIEWATTPLQHESTTPSGSLVTRRVIGQCKASSKTVGKKEVRDIRDVVEHHEGTGYFLAVSSQVSSDLASHLDMLKVRKGIWTEWWTRSEIEERLRRNPEVADRFSDVVKQASS